MRKVLLQQLGRDATVRYERSRRRDRWLLLLRRHRVWRGLSGEESWETRVLLLLLLLLLLWLDRLLLRHRNGGLRPLLSLRLRLRLRLCVGLRLRLLVIPDLLCEITKLFRSLYTQRKKSQSRSENGPGAANVRAARTATAVRPPPC